MTLIKNLLIYDYNFFSFFRNNYTKSLFYFYTLNLKLLFKIYDKISNNYYNNNKKKSSNKYLKNPLRKLKAKIFLNKNQLFISSKGNNIFFMIKSGKFFF